MANTNSSEKWYFTKEQLENTPSRKCGYDSHKELSYRQQAANFIQDMGQRLKVSQLCINTAIVYMHRFYVFHSFTHFPWHQMAAAALFLAAKVEEQPRKLEYVIRVANMCRNPRDTNIDLNSERYITQSQDLVFNENVLLQTLGFDVAIDHPHSHVVRCCHLVRASKDLAQTSYFMASNSLHLTTMCIQYKPTVVACFCILVACKWSNWEIPLSNEKKEWYSYVDPTVTAELLQQLTEEFLVIFEACPSRLKEKIMAITDHVSHTPSLHTNSPFDTDPKKVIREDGKDPHLHRSSHDAKSGPETDAHKHRPPRPHEAGSSSQQQREREYKERKERERLASQQKALMGGQSKVPHGHHRPPVDPKLKPHSRPPSVGNYQTNNRAEPRDILREASRDSPFGLANKEFRESSRDHGKDSTTRDSQVIRSDNNKEVHKRDYLLKPNVQTDMNSLNNYPDSRLNYSGEKQRIDSTNRARVDPSKAPSNKHESVHRYDESKPYLKSETDNIKKHLSASAHDKNSAYLNKSLTSTSQKIKSPFNVDASKSVPKQNVGQVTVPPKTQHPNGSSNPNSYNLPVINNDVRIKPEPGLMKEEIPTPPVIKRPSLFSPEKTPPRKGIVKYSPNSIKKSNETPTISTALSPLSSPANRRSRNYSSGSEPELRPVMKKIDQVEGFENLMRDNTIGINKIHQIPDVMKGGATSDKKEFIASDIKKEAPNEVPDTYTNNMKPPDAIPPLPSDSSATSTLVNGLETNPTLIRNLLKETPSVPHLPAVAIVENSSSLQQIVPQQTQPEVKEKEHHHHKSKKKNKEKHKHKDKEKSKEEREKKKKHKDKDREKHKHKEPVTTEPIKIKIHKDKIQPQPESSTQGHSIGLKIKIPKDKIKTDNISEFSQPPPPTGGLKIKIPKEKINNCSTSTDSSSRKRERDRTSLSDIPPSKISKSSHKDSKQNGRHSFTKVSNYQNKTSTHPPRFPHNLPPNHIHPRPIYPPPQPNSVYYYPQMPPPSLPNMSVPPPTFIYPERGSMYTHYYNQGYMYAPEMYQQQPPMPQTTNANPPLPRDAPPNVPPPPPPE